MVRHTFATTVTLNNGVPIETVSKMLGHKSVKITQHYAKVQDSKISHDMRAPKNKIMTNVILVLTILFLLIGSLSHAATINISAPHYKYQISRELKEV